MASNIGVRRIVCAKLNLKDMLRHYTYRSLT
jgi:hypothetical protein